MSAVAGIIINPAVPHVNMFHVYLRGDCDELLLARDRIAEEHGLWLFGGLNPADVPGVGKFEFTVGDAAMAIDAAEIMSAFEALLHEG